MSSAGKACTVSRGTSRKGTGSSSAKPRRVAITAFMIIRTPPIRRPGRMPPRNRNPMDVLDTSA